MEYNNESLCYVPVTIIIHPLHFNKQYKLKILRCPMSSKGNLLYVRHYVQLQITRNKTQLLLSKYLTSSKINIYDEIYKKVNMSRPELL